MATLDAIFERQLLKLMHADVRKAFPQIKDLRAAAGVTGDGRDWFVEIDVPDLPRFSHECRAYSATEARYLAWSAFMARHAPEESFSEIMNRRAARAEAQ